MCTFPFMLFISKSVIKKSRSLFWTQKNDRIDTIILNLGERKHFEGFSGSASTCDYLNVFFQLKKMTGYSHPKKIHLLCKASKSYKLEWRVFNDTMTKIVRSRPPFGDAFEESGSGGKLSCNSYSKDQIRFFLAFQTEVSHRSNFNCTWCCSLRLSVRCNDIIREISEGWISSFVETVPSAWRPKKIEKS